MKRNILVALLVASAGLGLAVGCGGGSGRSAANPAPRPAPTPVRAVLPVQPEAPAAQHMLVEPRAATLVTGGQLRFTFFGVREGTTVTPINRFDGSQNFTSGMVEQGGGRLPIAFSNAGFDVRYQSPDTPGIYHARFGGGRNNAATTQVELTVEHAPVGRTAILEQRAVTLTAGREALFTVREAPTPGVTRTFRFQVQETSGGDIAAHEHSGSPSAVYRAPATPGTYHVVLSSPEDPSIADTATVTVLAAR